MPPTAPPPSATRTPPKAVLFDLDDTMWPIAPVLVAAERSLHDWLGQHAPAVAARYSIDDLRAQRIELAEQQPALRGDVGAWRRAGLVQAFAATGADAAKVDAAMAHFLRARSSVTCYADVLPGLRRLQRGLLLGTISNGNADLEVVGLAQHFTVSLAAGSFGRPKPAVEIFHAACAALGVAPRDAVYVGDDLLLDVQAAQQAGLRAVWLNRNASVAHLAAGIVPDAICATFDELIIWLAGQGADLPTDGTGERA